MKLWILSLALLTAPAFAEPKVKVTPAAVIPGQAVLVTVKGAKAAPTGEANGRPLTFFAVKGGFQALFAVPIDHKPGEVTVDVANAAKSTIKVREHTFPEAKVIVEEEFAAPPKAERERIDADNEAIIAAMNKGEEAPQWKTAFKRPPGATTSGFGEWRTFNDGYRSQHLGLDLAAREGAKVRAINAGTVTLVRDAFLAGNVVVVHHGGGVASAYYHLSKVSVAEGDKLKRGAVVGLAGKTGRATGPHLHLSVHVPGGTVDPASFLKLRIGPVTSSAGTRQTTR